jgi:hypothetical protein
MLRVNASRAAILNASKASKKPLEVVADESTQSSGEDESDRSSRFNVGYIVLVSSILLTN